VRTLGVIQFMLKCVLYLQYFTLLYFTLPRIKWSSDDWYAEHTQWWVFEFERLTCYVQDEVTV